ncbi:MAG: cadherin-like beta sandwich domain-containing protein, partial [Bacilli bacterium]|nr:cadherin-like beta sandwich domain-containing protein [Bacilli bacterium]
MKRKQNGFTLVELLAVIVILAIIMIIAIPAVIEALNKSRKQTFFEYAQSIRMKAEQQYIQDLDLNKERTDCYVYDIKTDIGLGDTGSFDGWVKVKREHASSGSKTAIISIKATDVIQSVRTCTVAEGGSCKPNEAYFVPEGSQSIDVTKSIKEGQKVCVNYQIASNGALKNVDAGCKTYAQASEVLDTYKYIVEVTLTNKQYSVQDVLFNENMSQDAFYAEIDKFNEAHKGTANALAITEPSCTANSGTEQKGTTTMNTTVGSGMSTTTRGTIQAGTTEPTTQGTIQAGTTEPTTQGTIQAGTTEPTTQGTTQGTTTTIDVKDTTLLLNNLTVGGYNINFNPLTFYYDLSVPYETTSLSVSATPNVNDGTVKVQTSGQDNLAVGNNKVVTEVYNTVTGKRAYYRINVRRYASGENRNQTNRHVGNNNKDRGREG